MQEQLVFKSGNSEQLQNPTSPIESGDFVAVNDAFNKEDATELDAKLGSMYKGDKILGTTRASELRTTETLEVTGVTVGNFSNGFEIPAGTSVMDILKQMLMKELSVTKSAPTASIKSSVAGTTYEKGTVIDTKFTVTYTDGKYTGETGYSYSLQAGMDPTEASISGVTADAVQAGNEFTFEPEAFALMSAVTAKATVKYGDPTNVPVTNFNNEVTDSSKLLSSGSCSTSNVTFTPQLKWWVGSSENKLDEMTWESDDVRALNIVKGIWVTDKTENVIFPEGAKQCVIAVPASMTVTVADKAGVPQTGAFSETRDVVVTCGGTHTENYKLYIWAANAGLPAASAELVVTIK
jgi:hypothetical protein